MGVHGLVLGAGCLPMGLKGLGLYYLIAVVPMAAFS